MDPLCEFGYVYAIINNARLNVVNDYLANLQLSSFCAPSSEAVHDLVVQTAAKANQTELKQDIETDLLFLLALRD